jgi:hypothetical protein
MLLKAYKQARSLGQRTWMKACHPVQPTNLLPDFAQELGNFDQTNF